MPLPDENEEHQHHQDHHPQYTRHMQFGERPSFSLAIDTGVGAQLRKSVHAVSSKKEGLKETAQ